MEKSHLGRIPTELRLQIYEHLFEGGSSNRPIKPNIHAPELFEPSLALTCRQLRSECLPVFYASKKFIVDTEPDIKAAEAFLDRLGPELCSVLTIQVPCRTSFLTIASKAKYEGMVMERIRRGGYADNRAKIRSLAQSKILACASNELKAIAGKLKQLGIVLHLAWLFSGSGGADTLKYNLGPTPVMVMLRSINETIRLPSENTKAMLQPGVRAETVKSLVMALKPRVSYGSRSQWTPDPLLGGLARDIDGTREGEGDCGLGINIDLITDLWMNE